MLLKGKYTYHNSFIMFYIVIHYFIINIINIIHNIMENIYLIKIVFSLN